MICCNKILKTKISVFIFCMILIVNLPSLGANKNEIRYNEIESIIKNDYFLDISNIKGGIGFGFSIINKGFVDITNIEINLNINGGGIVLPKFRQFEIPLLTSKDSQKFRVNLFGFGLGNLFRFYRIGQPNDFPLITINVTSPDIISLEKTIAVIIIGSFVFVCGEFFNFKESYKGFTLFSPQLSKYTYLVDNDGKTVHSWKSKHIQGLGVYLLENGNLLRTSLGPGSVFFRGITNGVEILDWNGTQLWYFEYGDDKNHIHHDIEPLPNGNILMIALERKSRIDAINAGKNPDIPNDSWDELRSGFIIEVKPNGSYGGDIVWEWHVWDHLIQEFDNTKDNYGIVEDHPELIDLNYISEEMRTQNIEFNHINSIDYNKDLDQILLSVRHFNEIWIIDHSTTTEEAVGHTGGRYGKGGDILYRWGNPITYLAGDAEDQKFFCQHDARWIESGCPGRGNILVLNNGNRRHEKQYTSVDEIVPPVDEDGNYYLKQGSSYGPEEQIWIYDFDFFAEFLGGSQRLANGNTLICDGSTGRFYEVTFNKEIVWRYDNLFPYPITYKTRFKLLPYNLLSYITDVFKINRYSPDYPGLNNLFS